MIDILRNEDDKGRAWDLLKKVTISENVENVQGILDRIINSREDRYGKAVCNYLKNISGEVHK